MSELDPQPTERTRHVCCGLCLVATIVLSLIFARLMADPMVRLRNDALQSELERCQNQLSEPEWLPAMAHGDAGVGYPAVAPLRFRDGGSR